MRVFFCGNMAKYLFPKGYTPWNKGRTDLKGKLGKNQQGEKNTFYGKKHTPEAKEKMRLAKLGKMPSNLNQLLNPTPEQEAKRRASLRNHVIPLEVRKKISESHKGEKSYLWKGGVTPINHAIRKSMEYRIWREAVFARDNWTCQECNQKGGKLQADHIKPFAYFPELRFAIDNGRTLCKPCHLQTDTWGKRAERYMNGGVN